MDHLELQSIEIELQTNGERGSATTTAPALLASWAGIMGWRNSRWRREPPARAAGSGSRRQGRCVSTCGARTSGLDGCGRHSPPLHSPAAAGCLQSARQGQRHERDAVRAPHAMHAARHADAGVSDVTYEWRCTHTCTTARGAARRRAHRLPRGLDGRGPFGARARRARRPSATSQAREGAQPERAWRERARANLRCTHTCSTARGAARRPSSAARPGRPRAVGARARRASRPSASSQAHEGARPERVACARARKPAEARQRVHRCAMSRACHARGVRAGSERRVARARRDSNRRAQSAHLHGQPAAPSSPQRISHSSLRDTKGGTCIQ